MPTRLKPMPLKRQGKDRRQQQIPVRARGDRVRSCQFHCVRPCINRHPAVFNGTLYGTATLLMGIPRRKFPSEYTKDIYEVQTLCGSGSAFHGRNDLASTPKNG